MAAAAAGFSSSGATAGATAVAAGAREIVTAAAQEVGAVTLTPAG